MPSHDHGGSGRARVVVVPGFKSARRLHTDVTVATIPFRFEDEAP